MFRSLLTYFLIASAFVLQASAADSPQELPFAPGETMEYEFHWGVIPCGKATLTVAIDEEIHDEPVYRFDVNASTTGLVDRLFKVRDQFVGFADLEMSRSVHYIKKQQEGKSKRDAQVHFDWQKMEYQYQNFDEKRRPAELIPGALDPVSAVFALRKHDLEPDERIDLPMVNGKECGKKVIRVVKRETITIDDKRYKTIVIEPDMSKAEGVFKDDPSANLKIWLTDDERRLPVKFTCKAKVATVTGELVSYQPGITGLAAVK